MFVLNRWGGDVAELIECQVWHAAGAGLTIHMQQGFFFLSQCQFSMQTLFQKAQAMAAIALFERRKAQHILGYPSKKEYGCPRGRGLQNRHMREGGGEREMESKLEFSRIPDHPSTK